MHIQHTGMGELLIKYVHLTFRWYHQVISHPGRNLAVNVWSNHLRWFNTTDCEETEDKLKPISLKNFELNGIDNTDRYLYK